VRWKIHEKMKKIREIKRRRMKGGKVEKRTTRRGENEKDESGMR